LKKKLVKYEYEDFSITSVAKVLQHNRTIWIVNLAGYRHFITARIEDGEMEEMKRFSKGN
jgi:hypothetical protein